MSDSFAKQRHSMIKTQLIPRGILDPKVLEAMEAIPRETFIPEHLQSYAYEDGPLPIGEGQTISQPYIVALMIQEALLKPAAIALEIGTGSGYAAAVLSKLCTKVYTIERLPHLADQARIRLKDLGYANVEVITGDGTLGLPDKGPFDAIITTAGGPTIPKTLLEQLKKEGHLIIPVGDHISQELLRVTALPDGTYATTTLESVRFVPLIGQEGW